MKKGLLLLALSACALTTTAQNPGLAISEVLPNPAGTDSPFEWVELVATRTIDFSVTPYSIIVANNGNATANGWVEGGAISYGFAITSGTVVRGDVVYIGGSSMAPTGTKLRTINTGTTGGDGFGNSLSSGVVGNGGTNADGIAVFNMAIGAITSTSVPVDAIFYGSGIGGAVVSGGTAGYELPVNERYSGGKLQTSSFFAGDPASDASIRAAGYFNTTSDLWVGQRTWTVQTAVNDNTTGIQLITVAPPGTATISAVTQTVSETAGTVSVDVTFANANSSPAKIAFGLSTYTNATQGTEFSWASDTLVIPANSNGTFPFVINLADDAIAELTERIIVKITGAVNATVSGNDFQLIYVTDDDYQAPVASNELQLELLTSFSNGAEGTNSAEIVAYDPSTKRLYIANSIGAKLDVVDFSDPSAPTLLNSVSITPYGNLNSVTAWNGTVAAAVENSVPQQNGFVVFFDADGNYVNQVDAGAMPDMITFNGDHTKVLVACEGEPNTTYASDPEGSVVIIDMTPGAAALTNANVMIAGFTAYNGQEAALRAQGIRIFGPGSSAAQDFEPEYITLSEDGNTAYVSLQENNAMAVVDIATATVTDIRPLGFSDYSTGAFGLDASDQTAGIYITSLPVKGTFMPDALAHATIGGTEYIFSANEGDAREYTAVTDVARVSATSLDPVAFPDQQILKHNQFMGRLNVLQATGDTDTDGDKDELHLMGTRSFSIWNAATGALVFDSKDWLEQITAHHPTLSNLFNASNTPGTAVAKNRSDDKGPEPEGVATAVINGHNYLFVSLERVGGVLLFNIDDPAAPVYSGYYNNRTFAANGPDRGAEGIIFIAKEDSPNGKDLVILANEVSSTLSVFQANSCVELAGALITATEDSLCDGDMVTLSVGGEAGSSIQWLKDNAALTGETGTSLGVSTAGDYRVFVTSTTFSCSDTTTATHITVNPLPVASAGADLSVCPGTSVTLSGAGAQAYNWDQAVVDGVAFEPAATATYTLTATDVNGCEDTDDVTIAVYTAPVVGAGADQEVCEGALITLSGSGASGYSWDNGVTDGVAFTAAAGDYTVTGTDANGCEGTDMVTVVVNTLPVVNAGTDRAVCSGNSVTLAASGADQFNWTNGITDGTAFEPVSTQTYTVTGTDANGCTNTDEVIVTVNALPVVNLGDDSTVCANHVPVTLSAGAGFSSYSWSTGATAQTVEVNYTGSYSVTVTDANGCQDSDVILVTIDPCAGVDEQAISVAVFPNPSTGQLTIRSGSDEPMTVKVTDASGRTIGQWESAAGTLIIDLSANPAGTYTAELRQAEIIQQFRVVVTK